jgi:hypothetical protein
VVSGTVKLLHSYLVGQQHLLLFFLNLVEGGEVGSARLCVHVVCAFVRLCV